MGSLSLAHKMEVGVVDVRTTTDHLAPPRGVFVTEKTTCRDLVQIVLNIARQVTGPPELYTLYEVDVNSKVGHELAESDRPLHRQSQWLDPRDCFFEIRPINNHKKMRRTQSLEGLEESRNFNQRLLNGKPSWKTRKTAWSTSSNDVTKLSRDPGGNKGQMSHAMTKLKDSVGKLREHLDKLQRRKSMPVIPTPTSGGIFNGAPEQFSPNGDSWASVEDSRQNPFRHSHDGVPIDNYSHLSFDSFYGLDDSHSQHSARHSQDASLSLEMNGDMADASSDASSGGHRVVMRRSISYQEGQNIHPSVALVRKKRKSRQRQQEPVVDSSPETEHPMAKSISMQELSQPPPAFKPPTTTSKSPRTRATQDQVRMRRRHSELSLDEDHVVPTNWRTRQQDKRRSLQDVNVLFSHQSTYGAINRPSSITSSRQSMRSNSSDRSNCSPSTGRAKPRRTLPQIPHMESDLEDRKRRISTEAMARVKMAAQESAHRRSSSKEYQRQRDADSEEEDDKDSVKTLSGDTDSVFEDSEPSMCYNVKSASVVNHRPPKSTPHPKHPHRRSHEHDDGQHESHNGFDQMVPELSPTSNGQVHTNGATSHYSLQQIINDLRCAANKPIEHGCGSQLASYSSMSTLSQDPFEHARRSSDVGLDVSPLARPTPRDDLSDTSEMVASHPSLHRITASYELHNVVIENPSYGYMVDFGVDVYEAAFIDCPSTDRVGNGAVMSSPAGRRAVIGRKRGAFRPVSTCSSVDSGPMLSLVAIDTILDDSLAAQCGQLHEGDYVVEVNGIYVANSSADVVRSEIFRQLQTLQLLVARPKGTVATSGARQMEKEHGECFLALQKDKEKLQLKYNSIKLDSEKNLDKMADLKLELQAHESLIARLQEALEQRDSHARVLEAQIQQRDSAIYEWQSEVERKNMDVQHLEAEVLRMDERVAQLRKLLVQQTEVLQMQGLGGGGEFLDYQAGERVSAV